MMEPEKFPMVVASGMFVVVAGQIIFGILGFFCFQYHTAPIITYVCEILKREISRLPLQT